ncbi:hypothetical protein KP509_14G024100 [Ceratopteris richardii]|nr:hypothetical protein KP509_1Z117600 [Ceratopteris richardii]KAH7415026.1 hypothetical protein KP509_14G023900 [Ceratopteris richardii]KAH7415028.1 hypothetical protein KP509_14G024100 [Ceratopteris richardii]
MAPVWALRLFLACLVVVCTSSALTEANCKVKNDSGKKVVIVPVDVDITIEVDVGVTVELPPAQQKCYFKNPESGNQQGPVALKDGSTYFCKDGAVEGTIDLYLGVYVLGILQLSVKIFVGL